MARELEEELGLINVDFKLVEKYVQGVKTQTELIHLYYAIIDTDISEMKLQEIEVEKVEWIEPSKAQQMVLDRERESTNCIFTQITKILNQHNFLTTAKD